MNNNSSSNSSNNNVNNLNGNLTAEMPATPKFSRAFSTSSTTSTPATATPGDCDRLNSPPEQTPSKRSSRGRKKPNSHHHDSTNSNINNQIQILYDLCGVISHKGESLSQGHYVSYVRSEKGWDHTTRCTEQERGVNSQAEAKNNPLNNNNNSGNNNNNNINSTSKSVNRKRKTAESSEVIIPKDGMEIVDSDKHQQSSRIKGRPKGATTASSTAKTESSHSNPANSIWIK